VNAKANGCMSKRISHLTFVCKNLEKSSRLFCDLFDAVEVYSSEKRNFSVAKERFLLIGDLWIALMEGEPIERSYNHIAFYVEKEDLPRFEAKIRSLNLEILPGRPRLPEEGLSLYFYDYDYHLFELHSGDLATRLNCYQAHMHK
jgi:fosfomycin resistance protein FosX